MIQANQKAKQLNEKFLNTIWENANPNHIKEMAKQCAIITAEECYLLESGKNNLTQTMYWSEVKSEIEKL
jgi:hypothetical protein